MALKKFDLWFRLLFISPFVSTLALSMISVLYSIEDPARNIISKVVASFFWLGVISEIAFLVLSCRERKRAQKKKKLISPTGKIKIVDIGLLSFFQNRPAIFADIAFLIFLVVVVVLLFVNAPNPYFVIFSVSALFLSFNMHCILNGKNYRYYKQTKVRVKENGND